MDPKLIADAKKVMMQFEVVVALAKALTDTPGLEAEIAALEKKRNSIRAEIDQVEGDMKRVWAERDKVMKESDAVVEEVRANRAKSKAEAKELLEAARAEGEKLVANARAEVVKIASDSEAAKKTLSDLEKEIASAESRRDDLLAEIEGLKKRFA